MESQHQKWVNLSYLAFAILVGYVAFSIATKLVGAYDLEARIRNIELILRMASVGIGGILFFLLYRHDQVNQFMNEVMVELSRVTWPAQKDTSSATLIVIVMVVISGLILSLLDYCWVWVMNRVVL